MIKAIIAVAAGKLVGDFIADEIWPPSPQTSGQVAGEWIIDLGVGLLVYKLLRR